MTNDTSKHNFVNTRPVYNVYTITTYCILFVLKPNEGKSSSFQAQLVYDSSYLYVSVIQMCAIPHHLKID